MTIYEKAKSLVTAREAAEHYGLTVNRYGMALCPFHDDHNPSMKLDERFHCFGCGEDGDVIVSNAATPSGVAVFFVYCSTDSPGGPFALSGRRTHFGSWQKGKNVVY